MVKLNRSLTQLLTDLDLKVNIEELYWSGFDSTLMSNFFEKMEIRALRERIKLLPQSGGPAKKDVSIKVSEVSAAEINKLMEKQHFPFFSVNIDGKIVNWFSVTFVPISGISSTYLS